MITYFHDETPLKLQTLLLKLQKEKTRVRLFYGDVKTGFAWAEENEIIGTIGNSTGSLKIPLIINNARSMGGGAILDHCIVGILTKKDGFVYMVHGFNTGKFTSRVSELVGYATEVIHNNVVHARFKNFMNAKNYCAFMMGERFCK